MKSWHRRARRESEENLAASSTADSLAYVIYTSGTTGKPKGSLITHRNAVRLFPATEHWYGFNESDVWTLFHSTAFDFSVWEIWGALLYGGRLVVVPFLVSRSPEAFYDLLACEGVTVLNQTPSAFRQLIQAEELAGQKNLALRYVIFGGEALEMQSLRPWYDRHGDETPRLVNMYGITETTVHVTYRALSNDDLNSGSMIGVPIPDLQIYILDEKRQPVPIGIPGEMYVSGAGLARGYLRRPELTDDRFLPDHLSARAGSRLYRTGDLARLLPGRDIEYLGRIDQQVKIRGFRIELGEIESVLCQHPAVREAVVIAREDVPGAKRLVAYVIASSSSAPEVSELREHLKKSVPEYMVPAAFVYLERFPLTNNGKIDRKALPVPEQRPELASRYAAPQTPAEEKLAAIWCKVLRLERVGIHDNFFELGGDSILGIQVLSLAARVGLKLTPKLLFAHPTIAELGAAAGVAPMSAPARETVADITGDVSLTPIQNWFFQRNLEQPEHYNQAFLFEVAETLDRDHTERALRALSAHHDALRLRYVRRKSAPHLRQQQAGGWRQTYAPVDEVSHLQWMDLSSLAPAEQQRAIEQTAAATQASLDMTQGPLWQAVYFDLGAQQPARLLIVIHHLAVDGVSWRPLLEDFETAYWQLESGGTVHLPEKTASFKSWAKQLGEFCHSESLLKELPYWESATDPERVASAMTPFVEGVATENIEAFADTITVSLTPEETEALLKQVPVAYNTQINDVLLTARALAWNRWSGSRVLFTNLEGHGRENLWDDDARQLDLSRTVGWFTSMFPVCLQLSAGTDGQPGEALKSIKEQLRQIPNRGVGYGVLRYLCAGTGLNARPEPPMVFNYLGQMDQAVAGSKLLRFAKESTGPWHGAKQRRPHALEANGMVVDGCMEFSWTYCRLHRSEAEMRRLTSEFLATLKELIQHCTAEDASGRTPSDFPLARLDQSSLDRLTAGNRDVEDIYPLSPIQTLFVSAGTGSTAVDHWECTLQGELNVSAFQQAWSETVARHAILRSTIHTDGLAEPLQIVHRRVQLPWTVEDWSTEPAAQQTARWTELLKQDAGRPLNLTEAPAMRFTLIRLSGAEWKFLWSAPPLLLDGWSWPLIFGDASQAYEAISHERPFQGAPVRPYRDYVEWLRRQSWDEAAKFWKETLAAFRTPTPLNAGAADRNSGVNQCGAAGDQRYIRHRVTLSAQATSALQALARRLQITISTLVQGGWALQVAKQSGLSDVVYGAAFAARPADLPGFESIAGPFVNNLPVRADVNPSTTAAVFFRGLHTRLAELNPYQFTPLVEIQELSEVPWHYRLFDSLVVFQNYRVDESAKRFGGEIGISDFQGPLHTGYPMMLVADPGDTLAFTLIYDGRMIPSPAAERWGADLVTLFEQLPTMADQSVAQLHELLSAPPVVPPAERKPRGESQNYVPPQSDMEKNIAAVWQKVFGEDRIGIEENFFELGGHSLLLLRMHALLTKGAEDPVPGGYAFAISKHPPSGGPPG